MWKESLTTLFGRFQKAICNSMAFHLAQVEASFQMLGGGGCPGVRSPLCENFS